MGWRAAATLLILLGCCTCFPSHSLSYFYLQVPESSQGLPQVFSKAYLDHQPIARHDSLTRRTVLLVPWMEEVEKEDPNDWNREMETLQTTEQVFQDELEHVQKLYQQNGGLHTWQAILGCELREDGSKRGYWDYGYEGKDFISFNKETLRWVAAQPQAEKVKEKWDDDLVRSERNQVFLEETCIERLQKYLSHRKEALQRTEPPVGKVTHKAVSDNVEALICQVYGFYPKEISATWRRDGEVCKYETFHRNVAPNSDGTYYVWLSIEIDPKERDLFRCHLEHDSLQEPLVLAWKEEMARRRLVLVGTILVVLLGLLMILLLLTWYRRRPKSSVGNI
ncbi:major histocompatibility complex class I-related gene protein-like [Python bivittatus]|uniref:Major histocompatibility complex class I-related gene protein-like n=1 Tax=Python bivittatus TaxID=176946 RepID=A0A9F3QVU0_PYTBI|nr:major histocompatibility complex class I-related gene protein-like [Python bivittatus]